MTRWARRRVEKGNDDGRFGRVRKAGWREMTGERSWEERSR